MRISRRTGRSGSRAAGRLSGFFGQTLLQFAVSLVSLPVVVVSLGPQAWSGLVVVQAVAGIASVVVLFGWGATGPAMVAALSGRSRLIAYRDSLVVRVVLFAGVLPLASVAALCIAGLPAGATWMATAAYLSPALGAAWYFIGIGQPRLLFLTDGLVRTATALVAVGVVALSSSLLLYVLVQLLGAVLALVLASRAVLARARGLPRFEWRSVPSLLRQQVAGTLTAATSAVYTNLPLIFVATFVPAGRAEFALGYRLLKIALTAVAPLTQFAQGWVPGGQPRELRRRIRRIRTVAVMGAGVCAVGFAFVGPLVAGFLGAGRIALGLEIALPLGVALAGIVVSQVVGLACLAALGRARMVATSTFIGACAGSVLMILLSGPSGSIGVAWSLAGAELLVTLVQLWVLQSALRRFVAKSASEARLPPEPDMARQDAAPTFTALESTCR